MANLIFDYDGTLHDCIRIYAPAFRLAYEQLVSDGFMPEREWADAELSRWLGYSARDMWDTFAPNLSPEQKERCSRIIGGEMLRAVQAGEARLYPGVSALLDQLRTDGHRLILLSNCKRAYLNAHRAYFQLDRYFTSCFCGEEFNWLPKHVILRRLLPELNGETLVIGDRVHDMEAAQQNHLRSIGCTYGCGTPEELRSASAVVSTPGELIGTLDFLLSHSRPEA